MLDLQKGNNIGILEHVEVQNDRLEHEYDSVGITQFCKLWWCVTVICGQQLKMWLKQDLDIFP